MLVAVLNAGVEATDSTNGLNGLNQVVLSLANDWALSARARKMEDEDGR